MKVSTFNPRSVACRIGRAQSVPPNGSDAVLARTSVSRDRAETSRGTNRSWNAMTWYSGSTLAVTNASAAAASRGVNGVPPTWPHAIEPETSRPISVRFPAGTTLPNAL